MILSYKNNYNRYIDNNIINNCYRPHIYKFCAVYVITSVFNYLMKGIIDPKEVITILGWSESDITEGKIGNNNIINGIKKLSKNMIKTNIFLNNEQCINLDKIEINNYWDKIKYYIKNNNHTFIFHTKGHYTLVCGYIEEPSVDKNNNFIINENCEKNRKLVICEHRIKNEEDIKNGLLIQINYYDVINIIKENRVCCLILNSII